MDVSIFGLGYVGCVSMACLAKAGHRVIGVDVAADKNMLINSGRATIVEKDIDDLIEEGWKRNALSATADATEAVMNSEVSIICVGTPNNDRGNLHLRYIEETGRAIGLGLRKKEGYHVVAIRSTVVPGTCSSLEEIIAHESGKTPGVDFSVLSNPEFLREGSAVNDYFNPPMTVIGSSDTKAVKVISRLYENLPAPIIVVETKVAEVIKFVNNSYHALKIAFANEVGNTCKALGIDSHQVMELFGQDTKLNISTAYFKPGFAYGGSCLPKDLLGLIAMARDNDVRTPLLKGISESNDEQVQRALRLVYASGKRKVGMLGLSFKEGTDDLRLSPHVVVAETLYGKGFQLRIFDKNVHVSGLHGKNKAYMDHHLPHLNSLISDDLEAVIVESDVIILSHKNQIFSNIHLRYPEKLVIDLNRNVPILSAGNYQGICW